MFMKLCLKLTLGIVGLTSVCRTVLAADAPNVYINYGTNSRPPLNYSAANFTPTYSSNAVMSALNAQALLLKEMIQEHQKRAADLTQNNQNEKAKWETDLLTELQDKSARVQKSISQATQPWSATNDRKAGAGEIDDQLIFLSTLETRLEQIRQEVSAAVEDGRTLALQIGTNKVPEDLAGMSLVLNENQKLVKELQREQLDVELRKLEFRAILKVIQK